MAYTKVNWAAGVTPLSEANMDHLETQYDEAVTDLVAKATYDAHSILMAVANDTPVVLAVAASRLIGRTAASDIDDLTPAQIMVILSGGAGADFSMNTNKITSVTDPAANQDAATKKYVDDNDVDATREFFVPPSAEGSDGAFDITLSFIGCALTATEYITFNFKCPHDFTTLTHCYVIGILNANETIDWTAASTFAALTEAYNTHTDSDTANGVAHTANALTAIDISAAFTGLVANDYVTVKYTLDALSDGQYRVIGLTFRYS